MMIANFKKVNFKKQKRNNQLRIRMYRFLPSALQLEICQNRGGFNRLFSAEKK